MFQRVAKILGVEWKPRTSQREDLRLTKTLGEKYTLDLLELTF